MGNKNKSAPSPQRSRAALSDDDELYKWQGKYGYGRKVPASRIKKLARSRHLDSNRRADAWELLAFIYSDRSQNDLANDAHDQAFKIGRSSEYLVSKVDFLRDRGIEEALELLKRVNVSELPKHSRVWFWISWMDTAIQSFNAKVLEEAIGKIWKRDLNDMLVRSSRTRCVRLLRMLRKYKY